MEQKYEVISKKQKGLGLVITFKLFSGRLIEIDTNDYKRYGAPVCGFHPRMGSIIAHMVEPDGGILIADTGYIRRQIWCDYMFDCEVHNKRYGCKFELGSECEEFKNRDKRCRCFALMATQYDYDNYCFNQYMKGDETFKSNDNVRVYKYLKKLMMDDELERQREMSDDEMDREVDKLLEEDNNNLETKENLLLKSLKKEAGGWE